MVAHACDLGTWALEKLYYSTVYTTKMSLSEVVRTQFFSTLATFQVLSAQLQPTFSQMDNAV